MSGLLKSKLNRWAYLGKFDTFFSSYWINKLRGCLIFRGRKYITLRWVLFFIRSLKFQGCNSLFLPSSFFLPSITPVGVIRRRRGKRYYEVPQTLSTFRSLSQGLRLCRKKSQVFQFFLIFYAELSALSFGLSVTPLHGAPLLLISRSALVKKIILNQMFIDAPWFKARRKSIRRVRRRRSVSRIA